jgi:hypothetical protein
VSTIRPMRVLTHIKKLDDCFGQFLVRVICDCGASVRSSPKPWRAWSAGQCLSRSSRCGTRCSRCGKKAAEVVAVAKPRPRKR